jgi:kumamolisin
VAHRPIVGSTRQALPGSNRLNDVHPDHQVSATIVLRRPEGQMEADSADVEAVKAFAAEHGMSVVGENLRARSLTVSAPVGAMNEAFQVNLGYYAHEGDVFRGREGDVHVPEELSDAVVAVLGLDERKQARCPNRFASHASTSYAPNDVAKRYNFPSTANGAGQTVAIIELGGGYKVQDFQSYFSQLGISMPSISSVGVDGATNSPGDDADVEVALDVEVVGAVAPGAKQLVYFGPNTDAGFYNAIAAAVHNPDVSIVSISWGGPETSWTKQALDSYDQLFADAAELGVSILAAAGDNGSSDGTRSTTVDFPCSSPNVIACGGTKLPTSGPEVVWNEQSSGQGATGGGVSKHFAKPSYQAGINVPGGGRGVPDVAGCADPVTGYKVYVNGQMGVVGGTSAVAPLWAGLVAISNQINANRAGMPHAKLYANPGAFVDITSGNNGGFSASAGWDACTGLGTPKGAQVVAALASAQTPPPDGGGDTPPPDNGGGSNPPPNDGGDGGSTPPAGPPADVPMVLAALQALDAYCAAMASASTNLKSAVDQAIAGLNSLDN